MVDWWLVRRRKHLDEAGGITTNEIVGSIISLDKCNLITVVLIMCVMLYGCSI